MSDPLSGIISAWHDRNALRAEREYGKSSYDSRPHGKTITVGGDLELTPSGIMHGAQSQLLVIDYAPEHTYVKRAKPFTPSDLMVEANASAYDTDGMPVALVCGAAVVSIGVAAYLLWPVVAAWLGVR